MISSETTAYLAEAITPTVLSFEEAQTAALAFLQASGRLDQQIAHWLRLLQMADITEAEPEVRAHFEEHRQTLRALQREVREAESELQQAASALRQFAGVRDRLQTIVDALTTPPTEPETPPATEPTPEPGTSA